jgi:hypothetical protein
LAVGFGATASITVEQQPARKNAQIVMVRMRVMVPADGSFGQHPRGAGVRESSNRCGQTFATARMDIFSKAEKSRRSWTMATIWDLVNLVPAQIITTNNSRMVWLEGPNKHQQEVVGESHYQPQIQRATNGKACPNESPFATGAWLIHETDNEYDEYAVGVWIANGKVGHLPGRISSVWWQILRALSGLHGCPCACPAKIFGGDIVDGYCRLYGVWLVLPVNVDV